MYTRAWTNAVLGSNPANTIDTLLADIREDINERLTDILGIASFTADPLVLTTLRLNRTANPKILGGTASLAIRNAADTLNNVLIDDTFGNVTIRGALNLSGINTTTVNISTYAGASGTGLSIADSISGGWVVSVGPVDSAGAGYRALRVGNAFTP